MTLKNLINTLDELERKLENKSYTPSDVQWLIQELGEQAQTNQDLLEVVASAYQNGFKDACANEDWRDDPVDIGRVTFGRYQLESQRTLPPDGGKVGRLIMAMGLAGEVGETVDLLKKIEGHGHDFDKDKLAEELGDICWYIAALATAYKVDLDKVAVNNIAKLRKRYPAGFSEEASRTRSV